MARLPAVAIRGDDVSQFDLEPRDRPISLRISGTAEDRLEKAFEKEKANPKNVGLKQGAVGALIFDLGLDLYEARDAAGIETFRAMVAAHGGDARKAMADLLKRGFESWIAEQSGPKAKR